MAMPAFLANSLSSAFSPTVLTLNRAECPSTSPNT
jgi:hypothetical protein